MIKIKSIINESLDYPFKYRCAFKTEPIESEDEDEDTPGEVYTKDVLLPVQIVHFKTTNGTNYLWYAKQDRYDDTNWNIAFGVTTKQDDSGKYHLDIGVTGTGDVFRILSTVVSITNDFINYDEGGEIQRLNFSAKEKNRANLYVKRLVPKIENFQLEDVRDDYGETLISMIRTTY